MRLVFADNTTLEVLDSSSSNMIQFIYNEETFNVDVAHFTDANINNAMLQTLEEDTVTQVQCITNKKLTDNININNSSDIVTISLLNMNSTEQKLATLQQQNAECMSAIDTLLEILL